MTANKVEGIVVQSATRYSTFSNQCITCLVTACADYDAYSALPALVAFEGVVCGKTGWNSDKGEAYYKSDALTARAVECESPTDCPAGKGWILLKD